MSRDLITTFPINPEVDLVFDEGEKKERCHKITFNNNQSYHLVYLICDPFSPLCSPPCPLKWTGQHRHFLNSTCDIGLTDKQYWSYKVSDICQHFVKSDIWYICEKKRHSHATLPFLAIDMLHWRPPPPPPSKDCYVSGICTKIAMSIRAFSVSSRLLIW